MVLSLRAIIFIACVSGAGHAAHTVPLSPRATLGVEVTDASSGAPVAGADVVVHTGEVGVTNADGYVAFELVVGERRVTVSADGYRERSVEVRPFAENTQVGVTLTAIVSTGSTRLRGALRVCGRSYCDDTGPRTVFFTSWFPGLWAWKHDRPGAERQLDAIAAAGWQGIRVFHAVGGREEFWRGREVAPQPFTMRRGSPAAPGTPVPAWDDYDEQLRGFLGAVRERGLRLSLTSGDMQILFADGGQLEHFRRVARIAGEFGDTVAIFEIWNEGAQNGGEPAAGAEHIQALKPILPQALFINSAPLGDAPADVRLWSRGADIVAVHGRRTPLFDAIRRAFDFVYEAGQDGGYPPGPYAQTEPVGPDATGEDEVYLERPQHREDARDPRWLWGVHAMHVMTGQATYYFSGPSIRWRRPLAATWGFAELPALLAEIPRDVGQWRTVTHAGADAAVVTARALHDRDGEGPARIDQVVDDRGVVALIYGGAGAWFPIAQRAMRYRVVDHTGVITEGRAAAGEDLRGDVWHADRKALLIVGEFE